MRDKFDGFDGFDGGLVFRRAVAVASVEWKYHKNTKQDFYYMTHVATFGR